MSGVPQILLVDDQPDFLDNMSLTLEAAGYHTLAAANGFEALNVLNQKPVDLILSDIGMPQMGGYQLFQHVKNNPRWQKIPFVFITGYEFLTETEIKYGKKLGIRGYLTKPIRAVELLLAVEDSLCPAVTV
jgi:CheY-like chemotaxis protein